MKFEGMDTDSLMLHLVHLVVLFVSVGVIYLVYKFKSSVGAATRNFPPGRKGLPYIGETLDYVLAFRRGTPEKFITKRTTKYSQDVFRTSLLGEDMAIFCGAEGNKFLLSTHNKYFTPWLPYSVTKVLVDDSSGGVDSLRKVLTYPFLKKESLLHYMPVMNIVAKEHLDQYWSHNEQVRVFPLSKKYTLALVSRLFMSIHDQEMIEKLAKLFALVTAGVVSMPINLPGTAYSRAVKASRQMRQELLALVIKKKNELLEEGKTVASDLVEILLMEGMTEAEISNIVLALFFASHETTSTVITFIVYYLADYPDIHNKVLEEQMEILRSKEPGEGLRWEDIQKMKYTWCVACEAMRLAPPSSGNFREATTDITFAGYTIPKGWKAFWTVHSTHKNPKYFLDPENFDPSRFQGDGPAPYTFVPFGAGPRMCHGKEFARLEILIFIHNLITRFKWEKLNPNEKIYFVHSPILGEDLPIRIQPISIK